MSCGPGKVGDWFVPDGNWDDCCEEHDEGYAEGDQVQGFWARFNDRRKKDAKLRKCMKKKRLPGTKWRYRVIPWVFWIAVRLGGRSSYAKYIRTSADQ